MKKKERNILVYTDGMNKMYRRLTIQVDNAGNEWLTPEQTEYLETVHIWAKYESGNPLKASKELVSDYLSPPPKVENVKSSALVV